MGYTKEVREQVSVVAGVHGGMAALAHDGRPEQATVTPNEVRASSAG
jgi:hypothetical protein